MVSLIIPVCNQAPQLDQLLSTILKADTRHKLETVILDQGSTDNTSQVLAQYSTRFFIRFIKTAGNGPLWLLKLGADKARNKYLLFLPAHIEYPADFFLRVQQQEPASGQGIFFSIEKNAASASQIRSEQKSIKEIFSYIDDFHKSPPSDNFAPGGNGTFLLCRKEDFRGFKNLDSKIPIDKPLAINTQKILTIETKKSAKPSKKTDYKNQDYKEAEKTVQRLRYKLFNLGFVERAYQDLEELAKGNNPDKRRLAARELALWHANKYTAEDSQKCLKWLEIAKQGETDHVKIRQNVILEAESFHALDQAKKARKGIEKELKKENHADLYLARANLEQEISEKLFWINKALSLHGLSEITCEPEDKATLYDGLQTKPGAIKKTALPADTPKVTVIMPAYNAQDTISTALDSVLAQIWTNLEVLVVDDCSTDGTVEVIESYVQKDHRVRLIKAEINQGPYVARNLALREATGEFVTVNDADDWSHPQKIGIQVRHLIKKPEVMANTSELSRCYDGLRFFRRGQAGCFVQLNLSSLMFRRANIIQAIGYWDSVRFAADGEFKLRIKKCFGDKTVIDLKTGPLSFLRQTEGTLTSDNSFGYPGYLMGARKEYLECHHFYYQKSDAQCMNFSMHTRPFPVPEPMWPLRTNKVFGRRHFDVVIVSDFRLPGGTSMSNIEEIKAQNKIGIRTGLVQMARYDIDPRRSINPKIRELIDGEQVEMVVYGEKIFCELLIVRHPPILQEYQSYIPKIKAKNVLVIVNQSPFRVDSDPGSRIYDLKSCSNNLQRYFGYPGIWYPIGPAVRNALMNETNVSSTIEVAKKEWVNIIDVDSWNVKKHKIFHSKPVIGRHSRDHYVKWPNVRDELLSAYPENDAFQVKILGGAGTPNKLLGYIPKNWVVYPFNSLSVTEFLSEIDVFVYFIPSGCVEAFGRTPLEAMAAGIPVILSDKFKPLFKDAAIYATPYEVQSIVMKLYNNRKYYKKQAEIGRKFVQENFGYAQHKKRLGKYVHKACSELRINTDIKLVNEDHIDYIH